MKLLCASFAGLLAGVTADYASPEQKAALCAGDNQCTENDFNTDMKLTGQQKYCFFTEKPKEPTEWWNNKKQQKYQELLAEYRDQNCTDESGFKSAFDKSVKLWEYQNPNSRRWMIPMMIKSSTYPERYKKTAWKNFLWAKEHFKQKTAIDLVFIDEWEAENFFSAGYIRPFYGGGCWSYIGKLAGNVPGWKYQPMDIGWCHRSGGSIVHETLHAMGFVHEHSRADRDNYVTVGDVLSDKTNCQKYAMGDLNTSGVAYDFDSIMHYHWSACGGIKGKNRYRSKTRSFGQRKELSTGDIKGINDIYKKFD